MATGLPVLEREKTREESAELKAYGKLSGRDESREMTEDQKALHFNARISENYQKLINPDFKSAEEIAVEAPVFMPQQQAQSAFMPERQAESAYVQQPAAAPERARVSDIFRADSPIRFAGLDFAEPTVYAEPAEAPSEPVQEFAPQEQFYAEETEDLRPTATTIQYRSDLYENEKPTAVEEKKGYSMTTKGKLLMAVYALVVVVILALIIINTSVIKSLDAETALRERQLSEAASQYQTLRDEIDHLTSEESIIDRAEDIGMYFPD